MSANPRQDRAVVAKEDETLLAAASVIDAASMSTCAAVWAERDVAWEKLDEPWRLSASAAMRLGSFGALAYHFGTRKLKRPELLGVDRGLAQHPDVSFALEPPRVPLAKPPACVDALRGLDDTHVITRRPAGPQTATLSEGASS